MMLVASVIGFFVSISAISIVEIPRGGGNTRFSLNTELFALWCVVVPPAYFAAFVLHWPPVFVYAIMKMDEPVKDLFVWIRMRATKWLRDVTR